MGEAFGANFTSENEVGANFCATVDGGTVVDVWGGWADQARTRAWHSDMIANVYSTTKTMTAAGNVLHRKAGCSVELAEIVDAADVGVKDLARDADLAVKPLDYAGARYGLPGQEFEGDGLLEPAGGGAPRPRRS